ncbi:MAG: hypothetical protein NDI93_00575 [Pseudomonas sp.]|nr:hypothetical protein [Pseudomonas sp.]
MAGGERKQIDWEAVERDYRVGQLSLRVLAEKHGCTAAAISKKAKACGWVQDASQEVRERTRAAMLVQPRGEGVNAVNSAVNTPTREDIEVAVQTNLAVISRHRKDIGHGHRLVGLLFSQLEAAALHRAEIEDEIERECSGDETGARRTRMLKAISLPSHAGVIRDLSTALKNLIPLERQAYNLDEVSSEESFEERLARLVGDR